MELPVWALVLIVVGSFLISGLICKLIGVKILHSIGLAFVIPILLIFILHTFDVENGALVPHVGDFFVAIVIIIAVLYWIFLVLYTAVYEVIKIRCCNTPSVVLTKIKESYGPEEPLFSKKDIPTVTLSPETIDVSPSESLLPPSSSASLFPSEISSPSPSPPAPPSASLPIPISNPIDIVIFSENVDHRNMSGSLK